MSARDHNPFFAPIAEVGPAQLRRFGLGVGLVLVGAFGLALPLWRGHPIPLWPWVPGVPLLVLGLVAPSLLRLPYRAWSRVGRVLGWVNSRVILSVVFFALFTPIAVAMRLFGRDAMRLRRKRDATTYRVPSETLPARRIEDPF